jgi:hypothetical protein
MWKTLMMCSLLLCGCKEWKKHPDGPVEEFIEAAIEEAVEQGANSLGLELDIEVDFTPETPEPTKRSEAKFKGD